MATSGPIHDRHYASWIGGPIVTHQKYERETSGFDDRDDLAFGNHVIEFDQKYLDFPGCCRRHRDFHLHRFDERDLVAVADVGAGLGRERAHASRDFGHNLELWHATLRDRVT